MKLSIPINDSSMNSNVSDHLAISMKLSIPINDSSMNSNVNFRKESHFPRGKWTDIHFVQHYTETMHQAMENNIYTADLHTITHSNAQSVVNNIYRGLCYTMHDCVSSYKDPELNCHSRKRKHWWNGNCTIARDRNRLYHYIWKCCDKPKSGIVWECYKNSRKAYRRVCRNSVNDKTNAVAGLINKLHKERKPARLWNIIRKAKKECVSDNAISIDKLDEYFRKKFTAVNCDTEIAKTAKADVDKLYNGLQEKIKCNDGLDISKQKMTNYMVRRYIKRLNTHSTPGCDGITTNHLKFAADSKLVLHLTDMFNICMKFGVLPDAFGHGILVPILKKSTLNPGEASSYRPITISVIPSKLLELHILHVCGNHQFCESQFGYIGGRNTNIATTLAHDVGSYCVSKGSPIFYCSLDAQGAFDNLPHVIILKKAENVLPHSLWLLVYRSYAHMGVSIRWQHCMSEWIPVTRGIKQGGLTSPFFFNLFYHQLIEELQNSKNGVTIGSKHYNCYCYADDILLTSLTVSGLQKLLDIASVYIDNHGLSFNPDKTSCVIFGKNPFSASPKWKLDDTVLNIDNSMKYLGTMLGDFSGSLHTQTRIKAATRAFYGVQSAGIASPNINSCIVMDVYKACVNSVLHFGCSNIHINKTNTQTLDRYQGRFIKRMLGLSKWCRSTPLLKAIGIMPLSIDIQLQSLELLKKCVIDDSTANSFYCYLLDHDYFCNANTLINRCRNFAKNSNINISSFIFDNTYARTAKKTLLVHTRALMARMALSIVFITY
jgi:hypothetical protein